MRDRVRVRARLEVAALPTGFSWADEGLKLGLGLGVRVRGMGLGVRVRS